MTFTKSANHDHTYYVSTNGKIIGKVRKVERWVVRGTSIDWEAYRAGKYVGSFKTRNEAGKWLSND